MGTTVILLIYKSQIGTIDGSLGQIQYLAKVLVSCTKASRISLFGIQIHSAWKRL